MHDPEQEGTPAFFICDFCRKAWTEDNQMVEGHRGSLICASCLTVAYTEINAFHENPESDATSKCTMCIEDRKGAHWQSPIYEEAIICKRCARQAATTLQNDPDFEWEKPRATT